ncbi:histidine kinase [Bradyrhizobium nanningense]|uniref:histidine kinase n=1 Tax=Bradyrhizobium nanningense TaxID=1325118 RepID=A0A4Q0RWZ6_9BRAD|nr:AAA family ATPase [Bradyrhizobium nanningense]RXH24168.1 histidine kinase [Bradyrhizobium nanningense]RXH29276.1 histidine kinase [Bradyrhizobium nanningense]
MVQQSPNVAYSDSSSQVLWEDGELVFRRGRRLDDSGKHLSVLLVAPAADHPSRSSLDRLEHEYELKDMLDRTWAARPLALMRDAGRTVLVLDDPGGEPLNRFLGEPMEVGRFLRLAIAVTSALGKLHQRGLIHKDIKPANIVVDCADGHVRLTGFGIASRLPRERQTPAPPETIAGTLAYMAPEQTGRMNRSIDARSDLYALGVTLYEMLTGIQPFSAADPMEWIHCHVARQPASPTDRVPCVPQVISAIVMRLLAKGAEDRYQTAAGLEQDLRRCLADWETLHEVKPISLGEYDIPSRILIPEKLYGREHEIGMLLAAFERVIKSGTPELVLVSGYSGIGKSSVVNELHKVLVPPRGLFSSGKFDQYKRDIPYSTLVQAFQSLIRPLLAKSDAELNCWSEAFRDALGQNGKLIIDLVPELKLIVGDQPPVPELPPQQAQARFQLVFQRFLGVFARAQHPLVLFLDDLQWLDAATLDLLEDLLTRSELQHLMVIGAYRNNEVDADHPLMRRLEAIDRTQVRVQEIQLAPLACEHVRELISDALHCAPAHATSLAQIVHEKTAGNPFFVIQFLYTLAEEGLLTFDPNATWWSWDPKRIQANGYTDNVVDLMVPKLVRLPDKTQSALRELACLGSVTDTTTLSFILGDPQDEVDLALSDAVRQELVERQGNSYRFIHDRVQEAAYSLIPQASRPAAHLRIGRLLAARAPIERQEDAIFDIVNQLNRGASLIDSPDERERVAELNLIAGRRAKDAAAYSSALTYLATGCDLLRDDDWGAQYRLLFDLELHRAECEYQTAEFAAAEDRLSVLASRAVSLIDSAAVVRQRLALYTILDRLDAAVDVGLEFLAHVGIKWSPHPTNDELAQEYNRIWQQIGDRSIEQLVALPPMRDTAWAVTIDVLSTLASPALFSDTSLGCLVLGRIINLSLEHGYTDGSCFAYVYSNLAFGCRFGDYRSGYRFAKVGLDVMEQRKLFRFKPRVYLGFAIANSWIEPLSTSHALLRRAFDTARETGDLVYMGFALRTLVTNLLASGTPLAETQSEAERAFEFARKARFGLIFDIVGGQLALIRTLRGLTSTLGSFNDGEFDETRFEQHLHQDSRLAFAACLYWVRKLQARCYAGDYPSAVEAEINARQLLSESPSFRLYFEAAEYDFFAALVRAACCKSSLSDERSQHLAMLHAHHRQLKAWAEHSPENFDDRAALVGAEIARIESRMVEAMELYERAIRSARANGFVQNEAIAYELAAHFYEACDFEEIARVYLQNARDCYLRWGADGKVRQLDATHPRLRMEEPAVASTTTIATSVEQLDLATVIKVSQAISGEIVLENLLEMLMRTALEQAGAERGFLILSHGAEQRIAAEATTKGDLVTVHLRDDDVVGTMLPESVLHYVMRTRESVILDDALSHNPFYDDPYIVERYLRSVLCLPLVNQGRITGILYLENNLTPRVFTPDRVALLKVLASQAAISLENARLYDALADREGRIRRLVDANIIGIFIADRQGRILEANDEFLRLVGYAREDLVSGRVRWTELSPPEWRERDAITQAALNTTGIVQPFEKEFFRKDRSRVPVLMGAALFEEGGDRLAFVLDLTERRRAEDRLRRSEAWLSQAQRLSRSGNWVYDATTKLYIYWSDESYRIWGFDPLQGLPSRADMWGRIHPDDRDRVSETVQEAVRLKTDFTTEFRILLPDGTVRFLEGTSHHLFSSEGALLEVMTSTVDVTQRKLAEQALRESEQSLRSTIDGIPGLVAILAPNGELEAVNRQIFEYCGQSLEELRSWDTNGTIHPDDLPHLAEVFTKSISAGIPYEAEARVRRFDGEFRWFEIRGIPVRDASDRIVRWYSLLTDTEDRTQALTRLQQMQSEFAHMNRVSMMGELAASLSHEIAQPIASARNNARAAQNFLRMRPPDLGEVGEALSCVVGDADRVGEIIDRIREQIKKVPPPKQRFDLNVAIDEVIVLARSVILQNRVSVQTRLAEGGLPVLGDRIQLQQVLLNLILNAAEAMNSVDEQARELLISTEQDHAGALVSVRDSGPGIDPAYLDRIFDAFYTTKSGGTGMGLSICRSIIHAHGGRLWAGANEPRGAVFQFTLPDAAPRELTIPLQASHRK